MSGTLSAFIQQAPPVSRTLAAAAFLTSFGSLALGLISPDVFVYFPPYVWNLSSPQLWRPVTSFFLTSPQIGIFMDTYFLYRYASDCERSKFSRPGDFLTFLLFCGAVILAINSTFVGGMVFCKALSLALAYYYTALEDSSRKANFFIATFPIKFLPPLMLIMTVIQAGIHPALVEATGLVAAHLYLFLTDIYPRFGGGKNFIVTPLWIHEIFGDVIDDNVSGLRPRAAAGPSVRPAAPGTGVTASGRGFFTPENQWTHRGQGHRLGS